VSERCALCGEEESDHHAFLARPDGCKCDPNGFGDMEDFRRVLERPACSNCEIAIEYEADGSEVEWTDEEELGDVCLNCLHEVRCHRGQEP